MTVLHICASLPRAVLVSHVMKTFSVWGGVGGYLSSFCSLTPTSIKEYYCKQQVQNLLRNKTLLLVYRWKTFNGRQTIRLILYTGVINKFKICISDKRKTLALK